MIEDADADSDDLLRRLRLVTDAGLSRLATPELFDELLTRVQALLNVDTAAILLLDVHAQQLVATAAKGLEEEVQRGFRLSVGRGFTGRIAQERQPVVIERIGPNDVVSPVLRAKGLASVAGVPMFSAGELAGVLHVGSCRPRKFTDDDLHMLELVADRAALAARAQGGAVDRVTTLALQRSLLPARLPVLPGVDLAARYVPGHQAGVGGDWYDVFTLPGSRIGVVVGDVAGHGLAAAVVMGRLRSALRAYSLVCPDPADALTHLDQKVHHFEAGTMATIVYAIVSADRSAVQLSIAGHPPPMLARPDGKVDLLEIRPDRPLGTGVPTRERRTTTIPFPSGATLVCYTDGLVEQRGEIIDVGLERLRATIPVGPAEQVCAAVMAQLGDRQASDDIAVLAIRREP